MEYLSQETGGVDLQEAWSRATVDLQSRVLSDSAAGIWLPNLEPIDMRGDVVTVAAPNAYQARYLESHLGDLLADCLSDALRRSVRVSFIVMPGSPAQRLDAPQPLRVPPPRKKEEFASSPLLGKYTFDSFVVGASNRVAHAAALSAASSPGGTYNPLFIYGGVGLGKTHLMQAIGHEVKGRHPHLEVIYISGEAFLQNVLLAIRENKMDAFRDRFRRVDVWLVDDIQLIASREGTRTEAEFFFTFNALYQGGRQIVISSDKPPKELLLIEDRLRSRFEMGLMVDIAPPDKETRMAILEQRAESLSAEVPGEVIRYIADKVESNIRALEGALVRVIYTASIDGRQVDIPLAHRCLEDYRRDGDPNGITLDAIKAMVGECFGVTEAQLSSQQRKRDLVVPRQIAMYLSRKHTDMPLQRIATEFSRQDHTTVLHACTRTEQMIQNDPSIAALVTEITDKLRRGSTM